MKIFALIISLFSLSACVKISDAADEEVLNANQVLFAPQIYSLEEPNRYKVVFPIENDVQVVHRFIKDDEANLVSIPLKLKDRLLTDDQVQPGQTYVYEAGFQKEGHFELVHSFQIKVPQDLVVSEEMILQKDETWVGYNRIFLTATGVITTQGFNLVVAAKEMISQNGLLRTFPLGAKALAGQQGLHGGNVKLDLESAKGNLKVHLRGQHGGDGQKGEDFLIVGLPVPDVAGAVGKPGVKGKPGMPGGNGGNSGRLQVTIKNSHQLNLLPLWEPGQGGSGGEGGTGQQPYPPADIIRGPSGDRGVNGQQGQRDAICLIDPAGPQCWSQ